MAPWLNWIEQPPPKGQVAGSNPAGVATYQKQLFTQTCAGTGGASDIDVGSDRIVANFALSQRGIHGGRYKVRTCDPFDVNEVLYH